MSAITIDLSSLPSFSRLSNNESNSDTSLVSRKSVSRSEQYVSLSDKAFTEYMLNKDPDDIEPSDSASNDLPTKFAIKSNAVKSNANVGVSLDASNGQQLESPKPDEVDFTFNRALKVDTKIDAAININTSKKGRNNTEDSSSNTMPRKQQKKTRKNEWPKIDYQSDEDEYVLSDDECRDCKYKRKYFELRRKMKLVAIQLIEDM
ncbi:NSP5 protein [Rotavirus A]|uniref:Non-structural protein 5 n=1 Tax=Rotavirus A TaxID=28875 RepID=A0A0P0YJS3_9REOV|nr:NSP5 protein [Rotavirus A]